MQIKLNSSKLTFKTDNKKIVQNLFDFNFGSFITEVLDVNSSLETKAFYFLYNVNQKTNVELSKILGQENIDNTKHLTVIYNEIEQEWRQYFEADIVITKDFFEDIIQYDPKYLTRSYNLFESYLKALKIKIPVNFYFEYYKTFRKNMLDEFENNKTKYLELLEYFNNPINGPNEILIRQFEHYIDIKHYFTNSIQSGISESNETLKDLYIEPYFEFFRNNVNNRADSYYDFNLPEKTINVHDFLNNYFLKSIEYPECRNNYNMLFILGQPGQGKTSLCYKLIYDILEAAKGLPDIPLYFIKIRDLTAKDFIDDTFNTINQNICQSIDFQKDKCVIVLDGLDEAYMSGGLTDQDLKNLYERLNKTSKNNKNLKIILTSRLNYLNIKDPSLEGTLVIKLGELRDEQIKLYIEKFKEFYPENLLTQKIDEILSNDDLKHIKELLQQAVLMYFIALSNIDIVKSDSKSAIYGKIFDSLAKRSWDNNGQLNYIKSDLKEDPKKYSKYLRQYIRSIAFEIYQSPHLHISIKKLNELESTKQFIKKCFNQDVLGDPEIIKNISKYLLISFYFQNSNKKNHDEDTAIEFFHNSLWEYLTAEFIWEETKRIILNVDEDDDLKQINVEEYFFSLKRLIGDKSFESEIRLNLENIIASEDIAITTKVAKQMEDVFYQLIEMDILLDYNYKNEMLSSKEKMYSIFILMWTLYYKSCESYNNPIKTTPNLNELIFTSRSEFTYKYSLKNINFTEDIYESVHIVQSLIENVIFDFRYGYSVSLYDNVIKDTIFKYLNGGSILSNNFLKNVTFQDLIVNHQFKIIDNKIENCKFINVRIPHENWLEDIQKSNNCKDDLLKNHEIYKKEETNHLGELEDHIYITAILNI